ncbi:MAG: hypothetical protein ACREHV_13855, partial [Rhizomicrobium sp.]
PVVVTSTLPEASSVSRSPALNTALAAVGTQTPPEQFIFWVAAVEIVTSACATVESVMSAASDANAVLEEDMETLGNMMTPNLAGLSSL